jgi:hypothetical protein
MKKMKPARVSSHPDQQPNRGHAMAATSYRTSHLSLTAFLQARGHLILAIQNEGGRGVFAFTDSPELQGDILRWSNNEKVSIAVRTFVNGMRDLKGLVGV